MRRNNGRDLLGLKGTKMPKEITWTAGAGDVALIAGKTFTGGRPSVVSGENTVVFSSPMLRGMRASIKTSARPDLAALAEDFLREENAEREERKRIQEEAFRVQQEKDSVELEKMREEESRLAREIPEGGIRLDVTEKGNCDGDPIYKFTAPDGTVLPWNVVKTVGAAYAVRPGAGGAFAKKVVSYIMPKDLEDFKSAQKAKKTASDKKRLEEIEAVISKAGDPSLLPDRTRAAGMMKRYNDINNEGGDGFVPHVLSRDEYDTLVSEADSIRKKISSDN